ncbi:hypothetical protein WSK_1353 [Novosphingobium sp. Rr 2-17]|uniref:hypothetical protein n=1 Tax=Novosphingobium sp. Rr 2-17 TaxID=555793 RepID=UPI00026984EB|nr:hypothetical protein [Novosphingobium sp. Rr 2-17]EIZ79987.1 hypothetical protein WSK_1353 [Novosphingobium sp. Rr 2-17]
MSMTIIAATARIGRQLPEAELSIDAALLASARLMETMLLARGAEGVQSCTGQTALMRLAKAQRTLIESQNDILRIHQELRSIGKDVKAISDDDGSCDNVSGVLEAVPQLKRA